jgi:perosamine synthetase
MLNADNLYCGSLSLELRHLIGSGHVDNAYSWFDDARVYYLQTARTAIHRTCELLNIKQGDEILAPAYNCGTEIDALLKSGASVEMYDIEKSGLINFDDLYSRVSQKTRVIYVTHYFGFPQPLVSLREFCNEKHIFLVEDCALSLFSSDGKTKIGTIGDISVFNFPKFLPVPDGGVLKINNPALCKLEWQRQSPDSAMIRNDLLSLIKRQLLRASARIPLLYPGLQRLLNRSFRYPPQADIKNNVLRADMPEPYYYDNILTDKNLSRIGARIVRNVSVDQVTQKRRANFELYIELLSGLKNIQPLFENLPAGVNPLSFPVIVKHRQWICDELNELSIGAIAWWSGYHRDMPWHDFPNACFLKDNVLALPVHQQLGAEHINYISKKVTELVNWHA